MKMKIKEQRRKTDLFLGVEVLVLGEVLGETEGRGATRDDGDLEKGRGVLEEPRDDSMASLMISNLGPFLLGHKHVPLLNAAHHSVSCRLEVLHGHKLPLTSGGNQRSFIAKIRQVGSRESGAQSGKRSGVFLDTLLQGQFLQVQFHDLFSGLDVRKTDRNLSVKSTRSQEGRIEDISAVGSSEDNDSFICLEAVHFDEELVEGVFSFVVGAESLVGSASTHCVDFVDPDDAGCFLSRLFEECSHSC